MAINNTLTITGFNPGTGLPHSVRGTANTRAAALAELKARAKLTVMTPTKGSESMALVDADYIATAALFAAGPDNADMELTLSKGVGFTDKVIRIDNASVAYRLADSKGLVDISNVDIIAFATAYQDGNGASGYVITAGRYLE